MVIFLYLFFSSIIYYFFRDFILTSMFSAEYIQFSKLIFLTNLNFVFLSSSVVLMNYLFAINIYRPIIISFLISLLFFPMIYFIIEPIHLVIVSIFLTFLILINLLFYFSKSKRLKSN